MSFVISQAEDNCFHGKIFLHMTKNIMTLTALAIRLVLLFKCHTNVRLPQWLLLVFILHQNVLAFIFINLG